MREKVSALWSRGKWWVILAAALLLSSPMALQLYEEKQIDKIFAVASGSNFRGSAEMQQAVRELASHRGDKATALLVELAIGRLQFPWTDVQVEAIEAVADRADGRVSGALANLLQPHVALPIRTAAAEALRKMPCGADCVRTILHYLDRIASGEKNSEERELNQEWMTEETKAAFLKKTEDVYQNLFVVLQRERFTTLATLVDVYGLATAYPSSFALGVVRRVALREACPALLESKRLIGIYPASKLEAPRDALNSTMQAVGCR